MSRRIPQWILLGSTICLSLWFWQPAADLKAEGFDLISSRIVNGSDVSSAPSWMASLHDTGYPPTDIKRGHICGAVLIHREFLLTSGHCAGYYKSDPTKLSATLGRSRLSDNGGVTKSIKAMVIHPDFNPNSEVIRNDLAVLQLSEPVDLAPLALIPTGASHPGSGTDAQIYGWGRLAQIGSSYSNILQRATIKIQADALCQSNLGHFFEAASMTCAGTLASAPGAPDGVDSCGGDSGGPLIANLAGLGLRLVGLASWQLGDCASHQYYTAYTRLSSFAGWIAKQLPATGNPPPVDPPTDGAPPPRLGKPRLQKIGLNCAGAECQIELRAVSPGTHELNKIAAFEIDTAFQRKSCSFINGKGTCTQEELNLPLTFTGQTSDDQLKRPLTVARYTFTAPGTGRLLVRAKAVDQAGHSSADKRAKTQIRGPNGVAAFDQNVPTIRKVQGGCSPEQCDITVTVFDRMPSAGSIVLAATGGSLQKRICTTINSYLSCLRLMESFAAPSVTRIESQQLKKGLLETFRLVVPTGAPGVLRLQLQATDAAGHSSRIRNLRRKIK